MALQRLYFLAIVDREFYIDFLHRHCSNQYQLSSISYLVGSLITFNLKAHQISGIIGIFKFFNGIAEPLTDEYTR